jgi:hypothetical protein
LVDRPPQGWRRRAERPQLHWPREVRDFNPWLAANLDQLGSCIGEQLTFVGREVFLGDGMRVDVLAADSQGRDVAIEAQLGRSDARHLGQVVNYAAAGAIPRLIWVIADMDSEPMFRIGHAETLGRLNTWLVPQGVQFHAVEVSVESDWYPPEFPLEDAPLIPRMRALDLTRPWLADFQRQAVPPIVVQGSV